MGAVRRLVRSDLRQGMSRKMKELFIEGARPPETKAARVSNRRVRWGSLKQSNGDFLFFDERAEVNVPAFLR